MKSKFSRILLLALVGPSLLMAKDRSEKSTDQEEFNMMSLGDFAKAIEAGMPIDKMRHIILECAQGTELPLKMTIRGDVLTLEPNLFTLKLLKTFYIKSGKGPLLFSSDMKDWKEFSEFFLGKAAASLDFQNQLAQVNLELELNQRKNRWEVPLVHWKEPHCKEVYIHTWSNCPPQNIYGIPSDDSYLFEERTQIRTRR